MFRGQLAGGGAENIQDEKRRRQKPVVFIADFDGLPLSYTKHLFRHAWQMIDLRVLKREFSGGVSTRMIDLKIEKQLDS